jgi:hypothetical protein
MRRIKENPQSRLKKTLSGVESGVRSFAILTAENPMGEKLSNRENNIRREQLKSILRNGLYQFIQVKGQYGSLENPVVILNINKEEALGIGDDFVQESIIFARNYFDSIEFQYWGRKSEYHTLELLDTADYYVMKDDAEDFYTRRKGWKFNVPFSIFESINEIYSNRFRDLNRSTLREIENIHERIVTEENKTKKHFYHLRGVVNSLLEKQPMKIVNKSYDKLSEYDSSFKAYWVKGNDVYEVSINHIRFILDNPELFGFEDKMELVSIYRKHGEKIGQEARAREEIIREVAKRGWLRVRHYAKPKDYWTLQFDSFRRNKRKIEKFIDYAIDSLGMSIDDSISLLGYDDNYSANYSTGDGGVGAYLINDGVKK